MCVDSAHSGSTIDDACRVVQQVARKTDSSPRTSAMSDDAPDVEAIADPPLSRREGKLLLGKHQPLAAFGLDRLVNLVPHAARRRFRLQ